MLAIPPTVRFGTADASRPDPPPEPFDDERVDPVEVEADAGYDSSS
jgi:hypothetical protein